jgi:hypothetical protein
MTDDKANAKILLSADEAVEKKILDVLMKNPDVLRNAIKQMHVEDERRNQELRNQMYMNSQAAQQQAYQPNMAVHITERPAQTTHGLWTSIFGGQK